MAHFSCFPGASALSDFRQTRLLETLTRIDPAIVGVRGQYLHFVNSADPLSDEDSNRIHALMHYGTPFEASAERGAHETFMVVPRFGTVSPWASKATDLSLGHQWYYIVIAGAGMGLMLGPANTDAINQVGRLSYGEATGVTQTVRNFGASFGLAALGTLLVTIERNHSVTRLLALGLPSGVAHSVAASLSSNRSSRAPASVPASTAAHIYRVAQLSLADGTQAVFYGMAAIMAVAGLVALIGLRRGIHTASDAVPVEPAAAPPAA